MQSLEKASEVCLRFHDIYTCEALERLGTNISQAYKVITFGYKAGRITREALEALERWKALEWFHVEHAHALASFQRSGAGRGRQVASPSTPMHKTQSRTFCQF